MFESIEKVIAKETHELITYVESHTKGTTNLDDMQNNLKTIDAKMSAIKEGIKQIDVVAAKEQEIANKKEDLSLTCTHATAVNEKDKDKTKDEASIAERQAAREAKKNLLKKVMISSVDAEHVVSSGNVRPESTPNGIRLSFSMLITITCPFIPWFMRDSWIMPICPYFLPNS